MATEVICTVVPGGLKAANGVEAEKLGAMQGLNVMAKIYRPRNLAFHNKFFALLGVAREWADTEFTEKQFRAYVTAGAGYCDFIPGEDGMIAVPKSISFASMDETEFSRLYQDAITFICKKWVLDQEQLNSIVEFM